MKTAQRPMTTATFAHFGKVIGNIPGPFQLLRAQEQLNKFKALDARALKDAGLTQEDVDRATLADFLNAPGR